MHLLTFLYHFVSENIRLRFWSQSKVEGIMWSLWSKWKTNSRLCHRRKQLRSFVLQSLYCLPVQLREYPSLPIFPPKVVTAAKLATVVGISFEARTKNLWSSSSGWSQNHYLDGCLGILCSSLSSSFTPFLLVCIIDPWTTQVNCMGPPICRFFQ